MPRDDKDLCSHWAFLNFWRQCICMHVNILKVWLRLGHKLKHQLNIYFFIIFLHWNTSFNHQKVTRMHHSQSQLLKMHVHTLYPWWISWKWKDELQMDGGVRLEIKSLMATGKWILNQNFVNICYSGSFYFANRAIKKCPFKSEHVSNLSTAMHSISSFLVAEI